MDNDMSMDQCLAFQKQCLENHLNDDLKITLALPIELLSVISEYNVDFGDFTIHGFDFSKTVEFQGWKPYFDLLKGPTFPELVKEFWKNAYIMNNTLVCSSIKGHDININLDNIVKLLSHDNTRYHCHNRREAMMNNKLTYPEQIHMITPTLFKDGKDSNLASKLYDNLRIWLNIIYRSIYNTTTENPTKFDFDLKYMIFYLAKGKKINLPTFLFNYLRDSINRSKRMLESKRTWIPYGRLISVILIDNNIIKLINPPVAPKMSYGKYFHYEEVVKLGIIKSSAMRNPETDSSRKRKKEVGESSSIKEKEVIEEVATKKDFTETPINQATQSDGLHSSEVNMFSQVLNTLIDVQKEQKRLDAKNNEQEEVNKNILDMIT
ncbi:unnamed protein product [Lathyrus sativus]|nr:unnamed protein product [Lathyrus sativus]